jgi:hypothetical protein
MTMTNTRFALDSYHPRVVTILSRQFACHHQTLVSKLILRRLIFLSILFFLLSPATGSVSAQSSNSATGSELAARKHKNISGAKDPEPVLNRSTSIDIRNDKKKPTVYISFERAGKREPQLNGQSDEGIWLRLHNNTKWSIKLDMDEVPSAEFGDAGLFYEVVVDEKVVADMRCHACTTDRVSPGQSLLFSVPREHLAKGRAIRITFAYDWEEDDARSTAGEPQHLVSFDSSKLPPGFLPAQRASN